MSRSTPTPFPVRAIWLLPLLLGLFACERGADSGATANPVAPGRPGDSNPVETVRPTPGSINESPQVGGSTAQVPAGITGSGGPTDVPGGMQGQSSIPRHAGVGVDGGLSDEKVPATGAGSQKMGAAPSGSPNLTSGNAVGQR